MRQKERGH